MKKYSLSPNVLDLLKEYELYKEDKGVLPLSSLYVHEIKIGKKFAYTISSSISKKHSDICNLIFKSYISKIPLNKAATAYVTGKSYFDFIEPHRNNYFFLRIDLKNFFHSISDKVVESNFLEYFSNEKMTENNNQTHAQALSNLVMYQLDDKIKNSTFKKKKILPMGFPLSPAISNIVFRKIDLLIEKFCDEKNITYTRYADDLLFSSKGKIIEQNVFDIVRGERKKFEVPFVHSKRFYDEISFLVNVDGYKINRRKIVKAINTMSLNGYTISGSNHSDLKGTIRISNLKTKIIDKLLYEMSLNNDDVTVFKKCFSNELPLPKYKSKAIDFISSYCTNQINNKLVGYRSYIYSLIKYDKEKDCLSYESKKKYLNFLNELDCLINKRIK